MTWGRLRKVVETAILHADPPKALSGAEQAAAEAGVWLNETTEHGYGSMFIKAAAGDLEQLNKALDVISRARKILGDTRPPQQRRATAVGIIANPHAAQDLIARAERARTLQIQAAAARRAGNLELAARIEHTLAELMLTTPTDPTQTDPGQCDPTPTDPTPTDPTPTDPTQYDPDPTPADPTSPVDGWRCDRRPLTFGTAVLYYHLHRDTLDNILAGEPFAGAGVMRVEDIGPVIADQVRQWLQHSQVTVKPVIDLAGIPPVDHYETPPRLSEAIGLIAPPTTSRTAPACLDIKKTNTPSPTSRSMRVGHPDRPTRPRWPRSPSATIGSKPTPAGRVEQVASGIWLYRSPHGYHFLVHQHGTTALGRW